MSKTYEDEQAQLKVEIVNLQKEVEVQERQIENLEQFIHRVRRYTTLTELTPYALRELVKAVYVEAPDKSSGKRKQKVHIEYDLVGYIPVDELIKAEQAWPKSCLFQKIRILLFYDHRALRGAFLFLVKQQSCLPFRAESGFILERAAGIEPVTSAWEADILPLNYARITALFM